MDAPRLCLLLGAIAEQSGVQRGQILLHSRAAEEWYRPFRELQLDRNVDCSRLQREHREIKQACKNALHVSQTPTRTYVFEYGVREGGS